MAAALFFRLPDGPIAARPNGTVYSFAFSADPGQRFLYVADAGDGRIGILNRETLEAVGAIGRWERQAGQS
jgi:hypothetical protein